LNQKRCRCESTCDLECTDGHSLDLSTCECTTNCIKTCPSEHYDLDLEACECISNCELECGWGERLVEEACECEKYCVLECEDGYELDRDACTCEEIELICDGLTCPKGSKLDVDNCVCEEICMLKCGYGEDLDRQTCTCHSYLDDIPACDPSITCSAEHFLNPVTCGCECINVRNCKSKTRAWSEETCACEDTDCDLNCPRRFTLDAANCSCICDKECTNPYKPVLDLNTCKCVKAL